VAAPLCARAPFDLQIEIYGAQFKEQAAHLHTVVFALLAQREGRPRPAAREAGAFHTHAPAQRYCPGCGPLGVADACSEDAVRLRALLTPPRAPQAAAAAATRTTSTTTTTTTNSSSAAGSSPSLAQRSREAALQARADATTMLPNGWSEIVDPATGANAWWHADSRRTVFSRPVE
jgi:hypothetical protein